MLCLICWRYKRDLNIVVCQGYKISFAFEKPQAVGRGKVFGLSHFVKYANSGSINDAARPISKI